MLEYNFLFAHKVTEFLIELCIEIQKWLISINDELYVMFYTLQFPNQNIKISPIIEGTYLLAFAKSNEISNEMCVSIEPQTK